MTDIDGYGRRPQLMIGPSLSQRRFESVKEELPVREPCEIVVHCIVQQPFLGGSSLCNISQRANDAHDLPVGTNNRSRFQVVPEIMTIARPETKVLRNAATSLLEKGVEAGPISVAVESV